MCQKVSSISYQELIVNCKTFYSWIVPFWEALVRWPLSCFTLEKPDILDCSHPTDNSFLHEGVGRGGPFFPTPRHPLSGNVYCNLQIHCPEYHIFFCMWRDTLVSGEGREAKVWKVYEFTSQPLFLCRHATLLWARSIALRNIKRLQRRLWIVISPALKWRFL